MRIAIAISFLVVALGVAGKGRLHTEQPSDRQVAAPPKLEVLETQESPTTQSAGEEVPSLPLFEVGPEQPEDQEVAPPKKQPPAPVRIAEEKRPAARDLTQEHRAKEERCRVYLTRMMRYEQRELNRCYVDAHRRHPRLLRDLRLSLTVVEEKGGESRLESVALDVTGYNPPDFEKCVKSALEDLLLPSVDERVTVTIPLSLNPDNATPSSNLDDDDDEDDGDDD